MDIDMGNNNINQQAPGVSISTFPTTQFNFGGDLGNVFFNNSSLTEVSSSNMPKYSRSLSLRGKNRRHGSHSVTGNESRNLSIPKTGSFEGSDFSRMMLPAGSSFSFELQKDTTTIPSIQPVSTSTFKFNQETPITSTESPFQTNGATFSFQSAFPSQPFSAPVTFSNNFGSGLNLNPPATPIFNMNGDGQVFQNGTNTDVQKNIQSSNVGRPIANMRR
ncbi:10696_t:CDS:1, partial [Racocetra fulgida]